MSSMFDPHLAESIGYGTGRSHGHIEGRNQGYAEGHTAGWNAAIDDCQPKFNALQERIHELNDTIKKLRQQNQDLRDDQSVLKASMDELKQTNQTRAEYITAQQKLYDELFRSYMGLNALAYMGLRVWAEQSFERKLQGANEYTTMANHWLTPEYVTEHKLPHVGDQFLIEHLPIANQAFAEFDKEIAARKAARAQNEALVTA